MLDYIENERRKV